MHDCQSPQDWARRAQDKRPELAFELFSVCFTALLPASVIIRPITMSGRLSVGDARELTSPGETRLCDERGVVGLVVVSLFRLMHLGCSDPLQRRKLEAAWNSHDKTLAAIPAIGSIWFLG
jgi:hypothetical protein